MKYIITFLTFIFFYNTLLSQGSSGLNPIYENRYIVNSLTAGIIKKNYFASIISILGNDESELIFEYGLFHNFNISTSINISGLYGSNKINILKIPGLQIKYRILDEAKFYPAIALGISTIGRGLTINESNQEIFPGLYAALSKSFSHKYGNIYIHTGINYSFDKNNIDKKINFWIGVENAINSYLSLNLEYNPYINNIMKNKYISTFLNLSIRAALGYGITTEIKFIDLLNTKNANFEKNLSFEFIKNL